MEIEKVRMKVTLKSVTSEGKRYYPEGSYIFPPFPKAIYDEINLKTGNVQVFYKRTPQEIAVSLEESKDDAPKPIVRRKAK